MQKMKLGSFNNTVALLPVLLPENQENAAVLIVLYRFNNPYYIIVIEYALHKEKTTDQIITKITGETTEVVIDDKTSKVILQNCYNKNKWVVKKVYFKPDGNSTSLNKSPIFEDYHKDKNIDLEWIRNQIDPKPKSNTSTPIKSTSTLPKTPSSSNKKK